MGGCVQATYRILVVCTACKPDVAGEALIRACYQAGVTVGETPRVDGGAAWELGDDRIVSPDENDGRAPRALRRRCGGYRLRHQVIANETDALAAQPSHALTEQIECALNPAKLAEADGQTMEDIQAFTLMIGGRLPTFICPATAADVTDVAATGVYNTNPLRSASGSKSRIFKHFTFICTFWEQSLDIQHEVLAILDDVLSLNGRTQNFAADTPLLGAVPELDSMAVVGVINMLEERFGLYVEDDEIDGSTFATVGSLVEFVAAKLG